MCDSYDPNVVISGLQCGRRAAILFSVSAEPFVLPAPSMNADEECKGNAELEQDACPKRHRLVVSVVGAPFATRLTCADLVDGIAK